MGPRRRALEALFHHLSAYNLKWSDVVGPIRATGDAHEEANNEFVFETKGRNNVTGNPNTKDISQSETIEVCHFLVQARLSHELLPQPATNSKSTAPDVPIVVYHRGTDIRCRCPSDDALEHVIRSYSPLQIACLRSSRFSFLDPTWLGCGRRDARPGSRFAGHWPDHAPRPGYDHILSGRSSVTRSCHRGCLCHGRRVQARVQSKRRRTDAHKRHRPP